MKRIKNTSSYKVSVTKESIALVNKTLRSGWIGGDGPRVKEFEEDIGKVIENPNVVALNSGTSALQLALRLAGVKEGEVITTPMTCFATNAAIVLEGGIPIWADVDPESGNIDPEDIERKITKHTKAIMVVDFGGVSSEIDKINRIAKKFGIPVIEDAAQALGSEYGGKPIGTHSDFVAFSFQATKIITTGDGGVLVCKRKKDVKRAKTLRWYGIDREQRVWGETFWEYPISEVGYKMQMTDIAASIGLGQIPYLLSRIAYRRKIAAIYDKALSKSKSLKPQTILPDSKPNYWLYIVLCGSSENRSKLVKALKKIGVEAVEAHRRNDIYPVFRKLTTGKLPGVDTFDKENIAIPIGQWVSIKKAKEIASILEGF
ncbi:MAG: DegT/DnrJ/EryC1/StrS family aminotransferase [Candidatus Levybacteria bacterium]|nr:DegT/DnrJ/EryC1/StrS family aminotransferase [Candidatus Levybacteria bacterium]